MSFGIICYPMSTAFLKLRSSKIIRFSEQIMSMAKYPRIISRQTEANVHLYELPRKKNCCCKKCDQFTFPSATDGCCPFSHPGACVPHMFLFGDDSGIFEPAAPVKRYHASSMLLSHAALPIPQVFFLSALSRTLQPSHSILQYGKNRAEKGLRVSQTHLSIHSNSVHLLKQREFKKKNL